MSYAAELRWQRDAACLDYPPNWWFPERYSKNSVMARGICKVCLVRRECLTFALSGNEDYGIWGGYNVHELDLYKRARCRTCQRRISAAEAAAIAAADCPPPRQWECRKCFYRGIAERRRT